MRDLRIICGASTSFTDTLVQLEIC